MSWLKKKEKGDFLKNFLLKVFFFVNLKNMCKVQSK